MSDLYRVTVVHIDGKKAQFNLATIHHDSGPIPDHANFALQLLVELYFMLKKGYVWELPLNAQDALECIRDLKHESLFDECVELMNGRKEPIPAAEYQRIERFSDSEWNAYNKGRNLDGYGMSDQQYYLHHSPDYSSFVSLSELLVPSCTLQGDVLEIEVLEDELLQHLQVGYNWGTTAFDFQDI